RTELTQLENQAEIAQQEAATMSRRLSELAQQLKRSQAAEEASRAELDNRLATFRNAERDASLYDQRVEQLTKRSADLDEQLNSVRNTQLPARPQQEELEQAEATAREQSVR